MPTPQNQHPQTLGERPPRRRTPSHYLNRAENDPLFEVSNWIFEGRKGQCPKKSFLYFHDWSWEKDRKSSYLMVM